MDDTADLKTHILEAARRVLFGPDYDWAAALTYARIAEEASVDEGTIRNQLGSKEHLVKELVAYLMKDRELRYLEEIERKTTAGFPISELVAEAGQGALNEIVVELDETSTTALLTAFLRTDPEFSELLRRLYERTDRDIRLITLSVFERLAASGYQARPGFSSKEFGALATAIAEAVSVRSLVEPELDAAELMSKGFTALLAAWIAPPGDDRSFSQLLDHLDDVPLGLSDQG